MQSWLYCSKHYHDKEYNLDTECEKEMEFSPFFIFYL